MLLTTIRHKSVEIFTWQLCVLTFYLGFNQQVMCYELLPQGGIHKIHLQFIECNLLASYVVTTKYSPDKNMTGTLSARHTAKNLPACRDFHITFKKTPGFDSLYIRPVVSHLSVNLPLKSYGAQANLHSIAARYILYIQTGPKQFNPSLALLETTILMI
jgi:hypothetical protein